MKGLAITHHGIGCNASSGDDPGDRHVKPPLGSPLEGPGAIDLLAENSRVNPGMVNQPRIHYFPLDDNHSAKAVEVSLPRDVNVQILIHPYFLLAAAL